MGSYCDRCQRPFVHNRAYRDHISKSPNHNLCFVCNVDFRYLADKEEHEKDQHNACPDCQETFTEHTCFCDKTFASPSGLLLHIEDGGCSKYSGHEMMHLISINVRRQENRYHAGGNVCITKKSGFITDPVTALGREYDDHEVIAYDRRSSKYVCQYCLRDFGSVRSLERHLTDAPSNSGSIQYICDGCESEFDYPSGLCQHYESDCC
ncbi:hypothetical protein TWF718_009827 [Orbilia javanica]|uniref:C2H2-type domain-containing protein n=1 Tax=Orbilia javanica TaxID=47235 RepID=A0AAN8MU24_9PEZI